MNIGDRIRNLRMVKKMTQGELINGIASVTYLSKVENNQTQPNDLFIMKVSERLQISPRILMEKSPDDFIKSLEKVYDEFWRKDNLTQEDLALLHVQVKEVQFNRTYLLLFTTLIRYYQIQANLQEAKALFEQSSQIINLYDSSIEDRFMFHYHLVCGKLLMDLHLFQEANRYLIRCESFLSSGSHQDCAKLYFSLSVVHQKLNENQLACLFYSSKSLDYQKKLKDPNRLAMVLFLRAVQFRLVNQHHDSIDCLRQAKECLWDRTNIDLQAIFAYNTGRVFQVGTEYEQAIQHYQKSIELYQKSSIPHQAIQVHKQLIKIYIELKEWTLVEEHFYHAKGINLPYKNVVDDIELEVLQSSVYKLQGNETKYEKLVRRLIEQCIEKDDSYHLKNLATELAAYYYDINAYKKSAYYYHLAAGKHSSHSKGEPSYDWRQN